MCGRPNVLNQQTIARGYACVANQSRVQRSWHSYSELAISLAVSSLAGRPVGDRLSPFGRETSSLQVEIIIIIIYCDQL